MTKEKKLKKLTRSVFGYKNCPGWAQCAVINPDGKAYWCRTVGLVPDDSSPSVLAHTWTLTHFAADNVRHLDSSELWRFIGGGFDSSDWQNSMVLREDAWVEPADPHDYISSQVDYLRTRDSGLPDSGRRESFDTGAVRDDAGDKPRPDLISPFFLERLGEHMRKGAIKYAEWNWAKGIPNSRCYASLMRHLTKFSQGLHDEDHLAAAAFNLMAIIHNEEVAKRGVKLTELSGLVDLPKFERSEDCD